MLHITPGQLVEYRPPCSAPRWWVIVVVAVVMFVLGVVTGAYLYGLRDEQQVVTALTEATHLQRSLHETVKLAEDYRHLAENLSAQVKAAASHADAQGQLLMLRHKQEVTSGN